MSASNRRTVVTGLGAVTPLGTGNDAFWQSLSEGKSGVMKLQAFAADGFPTQIAAEVRDFDPKKYVKQRKSLKVMARDIQLAVGGAQILIEDSGVDPEQVDPTRFGVNCGAGLIATDLDELGGPIDHSVNGTRRFDLKKWGMEGMEQLFPLWMLKYLPNMPACHISITYNAQGPNNSITAGDASSTLAMGEAYRVINRDAADLFIVGGTDSKIHPLSIVRLALLKRLSRRNDEPAKASRPFDADRDGLVAGEGAGLLMFEELEHAKKRGAKIYGEIVGFGASCCPSNPQKAIEQAVGRALKEAGLPASALGHIVPSGVSCVEDDRFEAKALANILGDAQGQVPIVAYKSYLGQLAAAGGAVEIIASLLALKHGKLPATLNYTKPDAEMPELRILREPIDFPNKPFLSYDISQSGQCGAMVLKPFVG
jgi:3-oxoacyl-[acyl-carrier-protein] synthase II